MPDTSVDFTADADAFTESIYAKGQDLCGLHAPASLAATTAFLEVQVALDWDKWGGDAGATWESLVKTDDTKHKYPVLVGSTQALRWNPADMMVLERFRLRAVTAAGAGVNNTNGTIKLIFAKIRV